MLIAPGQRVGLRLARGRRLQHGADGLFQRADLERLDQEIARAGVHRTHRIRNLGAAAHRDDGRAGRMQAGCGQDLEAADTRHADVGEDQVEALLFEARVPLQTVQRDNFMTRRPQDTAQAPTQRVFIVAEEDLSH
jgi:hypothetical protein